MKKSEIKEVAARINKMNGKIKEAEKKAKKKTAFGDRLAHADMPESKLPEEARKVATRDRVMPERVAMRYQGRATGSRTSAGAAVRPKRVAKNSGRAAAQEGVFIGWHGSMNRDKRTDPATVEANRTEYFASCAKSRDARAAEIVSTPRPEPVDAVARARADYRNAVGRANERRAAGDESGYEAWMREARKARKIFRNR
ncbi:hypothetical protein ABZ543_13255 [Streptomyces roseifaciens]